MTARETTEAKRKRNLMSNSTTATAEALAALGSLPDSAMALLVWWRDEHGDPMRPCTREEIRDGLLSGSVDPGAVLVMAPIAQQAYDSAAESEALSRRRAMRGV